MTSAPIIISESANAGYDPRAVSVARKARERIDAECVILFGSRSRADWNGESDIDLMAIVRDAPARDERERATKTVKRISPRRIRNATTCRWICCSCPRRITAVAPRA